MVWAPPAPAVSLLALGRVNDRYVEKQLRSFKKFVRGPAFGGSFLQHLSDLLAVGKVIREKVASKNQTKPGVSVAFIPADSMTAVVESLFLTLACCTAEKS